MNKKLKTLGRIAAALVPYLGMGALAEVAQPAFAVAPGGAGQLTGITAGATQIQTAFQDIGVALGTGGIAWGATSLLQRHGEWWDGAMKAGGGATVVWLSSGGSQQIIGAFNGGATF